MNSDRESTGHSGATAMKAAPQPTVILEGHYDGNLLVYSAETHPLTSTCLATCWENGWPALVNTLAVNESDFASVRSVRRSPYQETEMVPPSELVTDRFDKTTNTRVFLGLENGAAAGLLWHTPAALTQHRRIAQEQFNGQYWTHDAPVFRMAFE